MTALLLLTALATAAPDGRLAPDAHEALEEALVDAVRARLALNDDAEVEVTTLRDNGVAHLPVGGRYVVTLPPGDITMGAVSARASVEGAPEDRARWIRARLNITVPTVVAARRVPRGAQLTNADLRIALAPLTTAALGSTSHALGRETRRALRPGEPVDAAYLSLPTLVRRGDRVKALVSGARFRVETGGEALAGGALGEEIRIRVALTNRVVAAVVSGPGMVEVAR